MVQPGLTAVVVCVIVDTLECIVIVILMSVIHQVVFVKMVVTVPILMEASFVIVQSIMVVLHVQIFVMHVVMSPVLEEELVSVTTMGIATHVCVYLDGKDHDVKSL